jgi:hypothetical protein
VELWSNSGMSLSVEGSPAVPASKKAQGGPRCEAHGPEGETLGKNG